MSEQRFQIGEFFLDPANRVLRYGEAAVSLSPKAFDALVYLVRNPGRLLTRDELMQALWPDSYVEEGNLSVHIFQVRRALGTAADGRAYIQTVPKKGYRFNGEVKVVDRAGLRSIAAVRRTASLWNRRRKINPVLAARVPGSCLPRAPPAWLC